jgi:hypothetical protein
VIIREFEQASGEFGTGAGGFVFEIDVTFLPGLRSNPRKPFGKVLLRVFFAAEADVAPVGCGNKLWRGKIVGVGDAESGAVLAEAVEDFIVEPGGVAEIEGDFGFWRD